MLQRSASLVIHILLGTNDFLLRKRLNELKSQLGDEESLSMNTVTLESRQLRLSELTNACDTVPFMAAHRLVIVEGLLGRVEAGERKRQGEESEWTGLVDYAARMPASTTMVLVEREVSKTNRLVRKLAPFSQVEEFLPLKGGNLQQWIHSRLAEQGAKMSPGAMRLLTEYVGDDLYMLAAEIEKLCLYAEGKRIEEDDVQSLTTQARQANIFAMIDAFAEKRASIAMRLLHRLLNEGTAPTHILAMLTRQLRLMVQAKELDSRHTPEAELRKQLGLSQYYPVRRLLQQSALYPLPRLQAIYRKLLDTDMAIKTGRWKEQMALDMLIAEVCA